MGLLKKIEREVKRWVMDRDDNVSLIKFIVVVGILLGLILILICMKISLPYQKSSKVY